MNLPRSRRSSCCRWGGESGWAGAAVEAGSDARRAGRFSLCPSKAASLATQQAVLPARLGWAATGGVTP